MDYGPILVCALALAGCFYGVYHNAWHMGFSDGADTMLKAFRSGMLRLEGDEILFVSDGEVVDRCPADSVAFFTKGFGRR